MADAPEARPQGESTGFVLSAKPLKVEEQFRIRIAVQPSEGDTPLIKGIGVVRASQVAFEQAGNGEVNLLDASAAVWCISQSGGNADGRKSGVAAGAGALLLHDLHVNETFGVRVGVDGALVVSRNDDVTERIPGVDTDQELHVFMYLTAGTEVAFVDPNDSEDSKKLASAIADAVRRGGETAVMFLHTIILGAARSGKSSLLKSLLDELHDENELSTIGMAIHSATTRIDTDGEWTVLKDMREALEKLLVTTLKNTEDAAVASREASGADQSPDRDTTQSGAEQTDRRKSSQTAAEEDAAQSRPVDEARQLRSAHISKIINAMTSNDMSKHMKAAALEPDFAIICTRDLGGQQVYQCVQPLFIAENTTFIVAYDASRRMEDPYITEEELQLIQETARDDGKVVRNTLSTATTLLDQLLTWFDVLLLLGGTSKVIVVGCKDDKRQDAKMGDPIVLIKDAIKGSPYEDKVCEYYLVDNTKSGKEGVEKDANVKKLRQELNNRCRNPKAIPVFWLRFTIAITMEKDISDLPWMSLTDATDLALGLESISHKSQMESLLKYHCDVGHLAYFKTEKLKGCVILDPQFVLDCVTAMLHVNFEEGVDGRATPDYKHRERYMGGFVTEDVAMFALDQQFGVTGSDRKGREWKKVKDSMQVPFVFDILEELSVLAIIPATPENPQRQFILPAAVDKKNAEALAQCQPDNFSPHVYICLKGLQHFPAFVYWQCIVECLLEGQRNGDNMDLACLSLQEASLPWEKDGFDRIRLRYGKLGLHLRLEADGNVWPDDSMAGVKALEHLKKCLGEVLRNRPNVEATPEVSLPCPCRSQEDVECLLHGRKSCVTAECDHMMLEVVEKKKPKCTKLPYKPHMIEKHASCFWLGMVQHDDKVLHSRASVCSGGKERMERREDESRTPSTDPWNDERFTSDFYAWFLAIHPRKLREASIEFCMINLSDGQELSKLKSPKEHNEELLGLVRAHQRKSYEQFLKVVSDLGFHEQRDRLEALLWRLPNA